VTGLEPKPKPEELTDPKERAEARQERARLRFRALLGSWELLLEDVGAAYADRDWEHLGYASWDEYAVATYTVADLKLSTEVRREMAAYLLDSRLSQRAIASVLGVSQSTAGRVVREVEAAAGESSDSPEGKVTIGTDNRKYTRPKPRPKPEAKVVESQVIESITDAKPKPTRARRAATAEAPETREVKTETEPVSEVTREAKEDHQHKVSVTRILIRRVGRIFCECGHVFSEEVLEEYCDQRESGPAEV
jgi:predicted XRE-type DNA-binding protein